MKEGMIKAGYLAVAFMAFSSWLRMFLGRDTGVKLTTKGIQALKYFTVESNLLMGVAGILYLLLGGTLFVKVLLLVATTAVSVTFLTVACFLKPVLGYQGMFQGVNLYLHLIVPLLAVALLIVGQFSKGVPGRLVFWSASSVGLYGIYDICNIILNGLSQDWYSMASGGPKTYLPAYLIFMALTTLLGTLLWLSSGGRK